MNFKRCGSGRGLFWSTISNICLKGMRKSQKSHHPWILSERINHYFASHVSRLLQIGQFTGQNCVVW